MNFTTILYNMNYHFPRKRHESQTKYNLGNNVICFQIESTSRIIQILSHNPTERFIFDTP